MDTKDIDTAELKQRLETSTDVGTLRETPNGYHVITEPFDYSEMDYLHDHDDIDIETDRMMLIEYLNVVEFRQKGCSG